jgi:hypothetical protein
MRRLFLILLFANIAFFAFTRLSGTPAPVQQPQAAGESAPPESVAVRDLLDEQPPPTDTALIAAESGTTPVTEPMPGPACLEWAGITADDLEASKLLLDSVQATYDVVAGGSSSQSFWVRVPGLASRAEVDEVRSQLRAAGHRDLAVSHDAAQDRFSVSLGVFRSRDNAERLQASVQHVGATLTPTGGEPTAYLILDGAERASEQIRAALPRFLDATVRAVDCPRPLAEHSAPP